MLLDLLAVVALAAIAYICYRKFLAPNPDADKIAKLAYEEGFTDAVRYFGLKKLYEEDAALRHRMQEVFAEAGVRHKLADVPENIEKSRNPNQDGSRTKHRENRSS